MGYPPRLAAFLDDLRQLSDPADRVQALISIADKFRPVPPEIATKPYAESHRVPGCESEAFVWVKADEHDRRTLYFDVLNPQGVSAMALAVILKENLDGASAAEIAGLPDDLVYDVFGRTLSMGKNLGLMGMIRMTKYLSANL